jgi:hypothetical protein
LGTVTGNNYHALLWSGSVASYLDLNPDGFISSYAIGTNGTQQAGYVSGSATGGNTHALLWNGSRDGVIDLHQFLPASLINSFHESFATGIDSYGNIIGYVSREGSSYPETRAVLWQPIPEPCTLLLLGFGAAVALKRKNVKKENYMKSETRRISLFAVVALTLLTGSITYADNIYVTSGTSIIKIDSSGNKSSFASGPEGSLGLAFDHSGNLYASYETVGTILKFDSSGNQ